MPQGKLVQDPRFQKVHNDPRFARVSKRKNKVHIDQRFAGALKDAKFGGAKAKYDKYGRRMNQSQNDLQKFYELDDDQKEEKSDDNKISETGFLYEAENSMDETKAVSRLEYLNKMARGELNSGSESSGSEAEDDVESQASGAESEEDIPMGEETRRFAVLNCDWSRIRAVDIFALCQSFAPATGSVRDVTIYPSDYGMQKMKEEESHGPQILRKDTPREERETKVEVEDCGDEDADYDSDDPLGVKKPSIVEDEGFDKELLRKYELQKLKYYYAVVTCDSVKTASAIFDNCDHLEYETSSNLLDLRYIPDDCKFSNPPKDSCTSVPENYNPVIFATNALQQTEVKLTWEEDDEQRVEVLTRTAEWKNLNEDDFSAYIASECSSSEDDENEEEDETESSSKLEKIKNRYRKALLGSDMDDDDDDEKVTDETSDEGEAGMEMTFTPGASDILKSKKQREKEETETPHERYLREKKMKKNQKSHEKRTKQKQLQKEQKDILKQSRNRKSSVQKNEEISDDDIRNFDMRTIERNEKLSIKKLRGKQKAKEIKNLKHSGGLQEDFQFDAVDPRFAALYNKDSIFALDRTDPKFKNSRATDAILKERRARMERTIEETGNDERDERLEESSSVDVRSMVENLKRKAKDIPDNKKKAKFQ